MYLHELMPSGESPNVIVISPTLKLILSSLGIIRYPVAFPN